MEFGITMNPIYRLIYEYPIISLAQTIFMVSMAVHAYRRGSEQFWYWVIFFVPFIGAWVYFFAVVARELVKTSPTLRHKCILAEILIDINCQQEARALLERALDDHAYSTGAFRRRNRSWAKQADKLLKQI
jgi:hypothetical protein